MKKGVIELSVNTLVIVIISLVILGAGVTLLYQFIKSAEDIKNQLDQKTNEELEYLLVDQGKQVALPLNLVEVSPGESHIFGVGILNVGLEDHFKLEVTLSKVVDEQKNVLYGPGNTLTKQIDPEKVQGWLLYISDSMTLKENEHTKEPIMVNVPKEGIIKGTYIFNVKVFTSSLQQYGNTQKFTVIVK